MCFPVHIVKLLKTPFLQNTSGRLLLNSTHSDIQKLHNKKYKKTLRNWNL